MYDPHQDATRRGISIEYQDLEDDLLGLWDGTRILLAPSLSQREERCVLAHELVHAEFDPPFIHQRLSARAEKRADRIAAERLIDTERFQELSRYLDPGEMALELNVSGWLLRAFLESHPAKPGWQEAA